MNMPYHRVIRTEFIALWLCSGKSHESGCKAWVLQTYGAYYRAQELGDNPYPEPSLSHCNHSSTARWLFLNFDREMAVQINCNSNNALYLQCFCYYYCYILCWRWSPGPWACQILSSTTEPQSQPLDFLEFNAFKNTGLSSKQTCDASIRWLSIL